MFCPKKLVAMSDINRLRLAATTGGGTVIANAVSYALAAILACAAACAARVAAVLIQLT